MENKKKKRSRLTVTLIIIAGIGLLLTTFLPFVPYLVALFN